MWKIHFLQAPKWLSSSLISQTRIKVWLALSLDRRPGPRANILSSVYTCAFLCEHSAHVHGLQSLPVLHSCPVCVSDQRWWRGVSCPEEEKVRCWRERGGGASGAGGERGEMVKIEMDGTDTMSNGSSSWENKNTQGTLKPEGWKICASGGRSDSPPYLIQFYKL